jgi:hypothetical protein
VTSAALSSSPIMDLTGYRQRETTEPRVGVSPADPTMIHSNLRKLPESSKPNCPRAPSRPSAMSRFHIAEPVIARPSEPFVATQALAVAPSGGARRAARTRPRSRASRLNPANVRAGSARLGSSGPNVRAGQPFHCGQGPPYAPPVTLRRRQVRAARGHVGEGGPRSIGSNEGGLHP